MSRLLILLLLALGAAAAERRVDPAAPGPGEDGATWATAYRSLPAALAASASGDEVWIKAGTYLPGALTTSTFTVPDGVALYGGFAGSETARGQRADDPGLTILSGEIGAATETDNVCRVVTMPGSATLDTLTVTRGYWSNGLSFVGTAVYGHTVLADRQVALRRCRITGNWAARSNAVYIASSAVVIDRCEFTDNRDVLTGYDGATGGMVCINHASGVQVTCSVWSGNQVAATTASASVLLLYDCVADAAVTNSVFVGNSGFAQGLWQSMATYQLDVSACTFSATAGVGKDVSGVATLRGCLLSSVPAMSPTTVENTWVTAADGNPQFSNPATPAGADGIWFTADDGLIPVAGSPCRGFARMLTATADPAMPAVDIRGLGRPQGRDPEPGAYEIDEGNRGPTATAQVVAIREDVLTPIVLAGSDPDGDALVAWITVLPVYGRLYPTADGVAASGPALAAGDLPWAVPWANTVLYQSDPDDNGAGRGSFAFLVDDGQVQSHPAAVTVNVTPVNDLPTIVPVASIQVREDSGSHTILLTGISAGTPALTIGDPAREVQAISLSATSSNPFLVIPDPLVAYTSPGATAQLVFTPWPNATGSAVITVTVHDDGGSADGGGDTTLIQFTVIVGPVNDPPQMDLIADRTLAEDTVDAALTTVTITGIAPGPASESGQVLAIDASSGNPSLLTVSGVDYTAGATTAQVHLALVANAHGTALVYVSLFDDGGAADGGSDSAARVFRVTVTPVDDPPALTTLEQIVCIAGGYVGIQPTDLWLTDPDLPPDSSLVYTLTTLPQHGEILLSNVALPSGGTFTQADVAASRVMYRNTSISGAPLDVWSLSWSDGSALGSFGPAAMSVELSGFFPPTLFLSGAGASWTDGDPPVAFAGSAVIVDGDDPLPWSDGAITVSIVAGAAPGDVLTFAHIGIGMGQIGVAGSNVSYGGIVIGSWSGGSHGVPLVLSLNGATPGSTAAAAAIEALRFASDRNPGSATRTIRIVVNDGILASAPRDVAVAVTPIDDPPVITTSWVSVLAGVPRDVQLQVDDPDSWLVVWNLGVLPTVADFTMLDGTQGIIRITPHAGISGTTSFWMFVSDGVNNWQPAIINLRITSLDEARPHPATDPPAEVAAGERLSLEVAFDCTEIGGTTGLEFSGFGAVPAGLSITATGPATALIEWDVPIAEPAGVHAAFGVFATDPATHAAGCWPVLLTVRPSPGGGG